MAERHFRHLNREEISELISAFHAGETQTSIAARFQVDRSTVHYHVEKFEQAYPEQESVYAIIKAKVRKVCLHPSTRCSLCGEMADTLFRAERFEIERLTKALAEANRKLCRAGLAVE